MIEFINKASDVPDRKWTEQAKEWRLPYWDFASFAKNSDGTKTDELRLPILATIPEVNVKIFGSSKLVAKPNPLYRFETRELMGKLEHPFTISDQADKQQHGMVTLPVGSSSLHCS